MSSLRAPNFKNSHFLAKIYFFKKQILDQTSNAFNTKFQPQ